jgi:hypothetical protein
MRNIICSCTPPSWRKIPGCGHGKIASADLGTMCAESIVIYFTEGNN